jgi:hypothetical protein
MPFTFGHAVYAEGAVVRDLPRDGLLSVMVCVHLDVGRDRRDAVAVVEIDKLDLGVRPAILHRERECFEHIPRTVQTRGEREIRQLLIVLDIEVRSGSGRGRLRRPHDERLTHQRAAFEGINRSDCTHVPLVGRAYEKVVPSRISYHLVEG